jgi:hypothetical protein
MKSAALRIAVLALCALPLVTVVLSQWSFHFEAGWRMDPIPFGFFLMAAFFAGRLSVRARHRL